MFISLPALQIDRFSPSAVGKIIESTINREEVIVDIIDRCGFFKRFVALCKTLVDEKRMLRKHVVSLPKKNGSSTACRFKFGIQNINIVYTRTENATEHLRLIVEPGVMIDIKYEGLRFISCESNSFDNDLLQIRNAMYEMSDLSKRFLKENTINATGSVYNATSMEKVGSI